VTPGKPGELVLLEAEVSILRVCVDILDNYEQESLRVYE
jgi:hypothetical protein